MATEQKKEKNPFKRIRNWWNGLTNDQQWLCVVGVWTVDGLLWGSYLTARHMDKKVANAEKIGAYKGYVCGQMDAYKEMAQNPYNAVNKAIAMGEKDGTVKRINF